MSQKLSEPGVITVVLILALAYVAVKLGPHIVQAYVKVSEIRERYRTQRLRLEQQIKRRRYNQTKKQKRAQE